MALVLAVGGVADFFGKGVVGVLERAHDRRVDANVKRFQAIEVARGIEQPVDGIEVAALGLRKPNDGAIGFGHDAEGVRRVVDEAGNLACKFGIEFAGEGLADGGIELRDIVGCDRGAIRPLGKFFKRFGTEAIEELRVDFLYVRDHRSDDCAGFAGRVRGGAHAP